MIRTLTIIAAVFVAAAMPARADDTGDIKAAVTAVYQAISGPAGEARDWDAFRALFLPKAVLTVALPGDLGEGRAVQLTVEDYVAHSSAQLEQIGFTETETRSEIRQFGELATVISAYSGVRADTGATVAVGVNTFILAKDKGAWKVASISWREADEDWPVEAMFD